MLKYLFGTETSVREKTRVFVTVEADLVHPDMLPPSADSDRIPTGY